MQPQRQHQPQHSYAAETEAERARNERIRREQEQRLRDLQAERLRQERTRLEQQRQLKEQQQFEKHKKELNSHLQQILNDMGYRPPEPSPILTARALQTILQALQGRETNPLFSKARAAVEREVENLCKSSKEYLGQLKTSLAAPSVFRRMKQLIIRYHESIDQATVSTDLPEVEPNLRRKMREVEHFLAGDWAKENRRGVLAVHVDEAKQSTILQIGIAEHGPIYITISGVLRPEDLALKSIRELLNRLEPFSGIVDPMAVINGSHQGLNYNEIFLKTKVVRAPSGNTSRLSQNLQETARRDRLSADNTVIVNSAPSSREEYQRVFHEDKEARSWQTWGTEAHDWNNTVVSARFALEPERSREALLNALSQAKNVIVIVAHCDGQSLFMPAPPPDGTEVTAAYLLQHRQEIAANAPFVYLFSCEAGSQVNLNNFASTLLECGASGVVASQSVLGNAEGRTFLGRLLDDRRGSPPIQDFYRAMDEVKFREMEVFLA